MNNLILPCYDDRIKPPLGAWLDPDNTINQGLVYCGLFNEGSGNLVNDMSGYGNRGTITGAKWTAGKFGPCLLYDGVSDCVNIPNAGVFTFGGGGTDRPFSLVVRCKMNNITVSQALLSKYGVTGTREWLWQTSSSLMRFSCYDTSDYYIGRRFTLQAGDQGSWLTCVAVYDGSKANGGFQLWVNGVRRDTTDSGSGAYAGMTAGVNPVQIGAFLSTSYEFIGSIDSAAIYNRALTFSEIQQLHYQPFAGFRRARISLLIGALGGGGAVNATVNPSSLGLSAAIQSPATHYDYLLSPTSLSLLLTQTTPDIRFDFTESVNTLALTVAQQTPNVNYDFKVSPEVIGLLATLQDTTQNFDLKFSASALELLLSQQTPSLAYDYQVALGSALALAVGLQTPDVGAIINVTVSPAPQALALTEQTPSIGFDYKIAPSALALAVSVQAPALTYDMLVAVAASLGMTCTLQTPVISTQAGRTYIVCSSTDPAILDLYVGGTLVARFT